MINRPAKDITVWLEAMIEMYQKMQVNTFKEQGAKETEEGHVDCLIHFNHSLKSRWLDLVHNLNIKQLDAGNLKKNRKFWKHSASHVHLQREKWS